MSPQSPRSVIGTHRVFLASSAAVALHLGDDNFLEPREGMSAADHLLSGGLPLLAVGLGALVHTRVRAGAPAVIALAHGLGRLGNRFLQARFHLVPVGLFGHGLPRPPRGMAGGGPVVVAARTLWRSRRRAGN